MYQMSSDSYLSAINPFSLVGSTVYSTLGVAATALDTAKVAKQANFNPVVFAVSAFVSGVFTFLALASIRVLSKRKDTCNFTLSTHALLFSVPGWLLSSSHPLLSKMTQVTQPFFSNSIVAGLRAGAVVGNFLALGHAIYEAYDEIIQERKYRWDQARGLYNRCHFHPKPNDSNDNNLMHFDNNSNSNYSDNTVHMVQLRHIDDNDNNNNNHTHHLNINSNNQTHNSTIAPSPRDPIIHLKMPAKSKPVNIITNNNNIKRQANIATSPHDDDIHSPLHTNNNQPNNIFTGDTFDDDLHPNLIRPSNYSNNNNKPSVLRRLQKANNAVDDITTQESITITSGNNADNNNNSLTKK